MKIPSNNQWTQTNEGDLFGVLHDTRNITIDQAGKIQLTKKPISLYNSDDDDRLDYGLSLVYYNSSYILITDDAAFEFDIAAGSLSKITSSPTFDLNGDALVFNSLLYISQDDDLCNWNGSSWNTSLKSLTTGVPHPMAVFDSQPTYKLAIGNGNQVITLDTSHNTNSTVLSLPSQFQVTTLRYRNGYLYIGTKNTAGGEARVFIWNGDGTNAQYEVPMGASWVFSMTEYRSTVAVMTDTGELSLINGSMKERLAALPVFYAPDVRWQGSGGLSLNGKVFNRAMTTIGETIYINVEGETDTGFLPEMKSGLWKYHPDSGLNHRAGYSTDKFVEDTNVSLSDSTLTTSAAHNLVSGDSVVFSGTSGLTGVDTGVVYYASVVSSTEIKLALSRRSLENSNFVTIGGSPTSSDKLVYTPNTDYGPLYNTASGAVMRTVIDETPLRNWTSEIIYSGRTKAPDEDTVYVICGLSDQYNVGTLSTQRVYSDGPSDTWKELYAFIDDALTSSDEVVIKFQNEYQDAKPTLALAGTWGSANTIHSTSTAFDEDDWSSVEEGDEVYIVEGYGQGRSAHVTNVSTSSNTYVLTLDESFGSAGNETSLIAENWIKLGTYTKDRMDADYVRTAITPEGKSAWVRVKLELRGFQTKIAHLLLTNGTNKSV